MNKRTRKKINESRRKEIHTLLDMVLDINGLSPRKRDETGDLPTVFFEFSGHTGRIYLSAHTHGWFADSYPDLSSNARVQDLKGLIKIGDELRERYLR